MRFISSRRLKWRVQQANTANQASLTDLKEFRAQQGHPNLSQEALVKLYAHFQEWKSPRQGAKFEPLLTSAFSSSVSVTCHVWIVG